MTIYESDATTDDDVCPTHDRVHQPREHPVKCWICGCPTMHPHGEHLGCSNAVSELLFSC